MNAKYRKRRNKTGIMLLVRFLRKSLDCATDTRTVFLKGWGII